MGLTEQILNVIIAVQAYKRFYIADYIVKHSEPCLSDWFNKTFEYFKSLELPEGMKANRACFEAVYSYPVGAVIDTPMEDLPKKFKFMY